MDNTYNGISEETAKELCDVLEKSITTAEESFKILKETMNANIVNAYLSLLEKRVELKLKVMSAYFFTRWYWKRKEAKNEKKYNDFISNKELMDIVDEEFKRETLELAKIKPITPTS